jgi:predicted tellurium resistance membrane protein TerC
MDRLINIDLLEIVLGIDNIIFISIATVLPVESRKKATKIGMFLAMFMRIAPLFGINLLIQMKEPWFTIDLRWLSGNYGTKYYFTSGWFVPYLQEHQRNQRKVDIRVEEKG